MALYAKSIVFIVLLGERQNDEWRLKIVVVDKGQICSHIAPSTYSVDIV